MRCRIVGAEDLVDARRYDLAVLDDDGAEGPPAVLDIGLRKLDRLAQEAFFSVIDVHSNLISGNALEIRTVWPHARIAGPSRICASRSLIAACRVSLPTFLPVKSVT